MSSYWGNNLHFQIFGESHGPAIGAVIDGLPPGFPIDFTALQAFLDRRAPGRTPTATARREADQPEILSGLLNGKTTGAPLAVLIRNTAARSQDYDDLLNLPRPGHADYTHACAFHGANDHRGGGHTSGRLTAPLCAIGGIVLQILAERGITVGAHIAAIAGINDTPFNDTTPAPDDLLAPGRKPFPVIDDTAGQRMQQAIADARQDGDSVGGRIEACAINVPAGLGKPMFAGAENRIASLLLGIPAVRGIEFGCGMAAAEWRGSQHNDPFFISPDDGSVRTRTNHCGGILGGITDGMPVIVRVAIKPTPSIATPQETVNLQTRQPAVITVGGRHDPCIVPRAVPVVEAALALALYDLLLD